MAATAHILPNLEITAADEMDLRSDVEFDLGDGDIELDLAPPIYAQDDDVSIGDAQEDIMTADRDEDDEMTDPDFDYEEENVQYGGEANTDHVSPSNTVATQEQATAPEDDDDLIDYSDEEEDTPSLQHIYTGQHVGGIHVAVNDDQAPHQEDPQVAVHTPGSVSNINNGEHEDYIQSNESVEHTTNDQEEQYAPDFDADHEADYNTDGEHGGVQLQDTEGRTDDSEYDHDVPEDQHAFETRTITVNYEGAELWLFKQHDTDESGDWILEDISLLHSSLSDLFQACRASISDEISHELELGFRFDNLHNMELYEDNTACVAVSLGRLLDLYHTLHAQDEVYDPESFYMCLVSRPRFATLLGDVAKYAEQGSGFSGLAIAVAAGETHFPVTHSGHSTEYDVTEWENEEVEQHEVTELTGGVEPKAEDEEHHDDNNSRTGSASGNVAHVDSVPQTDNDPAAPEHADLGEDLGQHDQGADETTEQGLQSLIELEQEQKDNDFIDYSDAEEDEKPHSVNYKATSPSSSTVQGDDTAAGEMSTQTVGSSKQEDLHDGGEDAAGSDTENDAGAHSDSKEQPSQEDNTALYEDYAAAYGQAVPFQGHQTGATETYLAETELEVYTNQEYTGYENQDPDQHLENDFISGADFDDASVSGSANAGVSLDDGEDFLDLENTTEWLVDQDPTSKVPVDVGLVPTVTNTTQLEEEEGGVLEQPAVAASSAADPVAASSEDLQESPLQGQKRSIDEVGDSVGDALDFTGMPLFYIHLAGTDIVDSDMKRPRV
ncbi:hypothetical protein GQ44DRAFT_699026 [Phaeosphaeriaceae sp. PMI808]|nr:hypothetical protein GQ44DRAFT_699026 [Phaeosphaeriaceae sp. PMI808]